MSDEREEDAAVELPTSCELERAIASETVRIESVNAAISARNQALDIATSALGAALTAAAGRVPFIEGEDVADLAAKMLGAVAEEFTS